VNRPRTGDKYKWCGILIEIGDVDPGGRWAIIHRTWPENDRGALGIVPAHTSDKEQPTPDGKLPDDWELIEAASGPEPAQEPTATAGALRVWDGDWPAPAPCYRSGLGFMVHGPGCEHPA
jgi:hypothetical protein